MIPLRDTVQSRTYPVVNSGLIALNVVFFLIELAQGTDLNRFIFLYGLVPARYSNPEISAYFSWGSQAFALISFMFLHGGFWHLLGNMWSLYIFGDNVEDRMGHLRYLIFYLLCGWTSGLTHLFLNWGSAVPTIGASGAIAGIMGAYLIVFPTSRILTLIPIFFIPYFVEIPAFFFLGIWFFLQFISAAGSQGQMGGIAWWAHVGGFVFGMLFVKLFTLIPSSGIGERFKAATLKKGTPRLQLIRTRPSGNGLNLQGDIRITPREAHNGTTKLVNIPWNYRRRLFRVKIPPGMEEGQSLRLVGLGRQTGRERGDLYLHVTVGPE